MKKNMFVIFLFFLFFSTLAPVYSQSYKNNILEESDKAFFPKITKFMLTMKLYEKNKYDKYYTIECLIKGNRKYLALLKEPPVVRRTSHLRVGDKIWIHFGKINRTKEVSAKASFSESTLSEEDLLSSSLGYYYTLDNVEETEIEGEKILKLSLKARDKNTAYARIESFIDAKTLLPIKRYYYSFSNQKIKEMKVLEIRKKGGKLEYIHFNMIDCLKKGSYTEVEMKKFEYPTDLNDKIFTKRYMELASE